MKLAIVLILLLQMISITAGQCPHPEFIRKYLCKNCTNKKEALDFSMSARDATMFENTVLTGSLMECNFQVNETYESISYGHCQNSELRPVYQCKHWDSIRYCNLEGARCRTYHYVGNGQLFMYYQCMY